MDSYRYVPVKGRPVKTYIFQVEVEQEEDGHWSAWIEALPGCATWGYTKEEAVRNIHDAVEAYVASMRKAGDVIPQKAVLQVIDEPAVAVTI
jgi:predicted RNase H-like HicB family nuclease